MHNIFVCVLFLIYPNILHAQAPQTDVKEKLVRLQREVEQKSHEVRRVSKLVEDTNIILKKQAKELKALRQVESELREKVQQTTIDIEQTRAEKARVQERIEDVKLLTQKRLKALYVQRWESVIDRLLTHSNSASFQRTSYFVGKLRSFDRALLEEHALLNDELLVKEEDLVALDIEQSKLIKQVAQQREKTEALLKKNTRLISTYEVQREELEELLLGLQSQALRLETIVSSLTYGGMEFVSRTRSTPKTLSLIPQERVSSFSGVGLSKGQLTVPVQGRVLRAFGKRKHADFSDYVFQKGIEYLTEPGSDVVSIQDGKVIYKGKMPAFGTILIVDHGKRYYSLYGRLDSVRATVGDKVEKGAVIASASETEQEAGNFYFEIRKKGEPVNPQNYYSKKL